MGNPIILPNPVAPVSAGEAMGATAQIASWRNVAVDIGVRSQLRQCESF